MLNQDKHKVVMFRLLTDILRDSFLAAVLGFKGGTACYLFYDLPRFSVDLDFDFLASVKEGVIENVSAKIEKIIQAAGLKTKDKSLKQNTVFFLISYAEEAQNIKIEVSRRDYPNTYEIKDFYGLPMRVLTKACIFAHKLVAATDRKKMASRDFFDLHFFFREAWPVNEEIIRLRTGKSFKEYLKILEDFIDKNLSSRNILQGIGELINATQKAWVKNELKNELLRIISFYRKGS